MNRGRRARRADADVLRSAAVRLRDDPELARHVGLAGPEDAAALAALLDLLAAELPHVDSKNPPVGGRVVRASARWTRLTARAGRRNS